MHPPHQKRQHLVLHAHHWLATGEVPEDVLDLPTGEVTLDLSRSETLHPITPDRVGQLADQAEAFIGARIDGVQQVSLLFHQPCVGHVEPPCEDTRDVFGGRLPLGPLRLLLASLRLLEEARKEEKQ